MTFILRGPAAVGAGARVEGAWVGGTAGGGWTGVGAQPAKINPPAATALYRKNSRREIWTGDLDFMIFSFLNSVEMEISTRKMDSRSSRVWIASFLVGIIPSCFPSKCPV
jgi:hypothetical protein